jgi:hypothetical protein
MISDRSLYAIKKKIRDDWSGSDRSHDEINRGYGRELKSPPYIRCTGGRKQRRTEFTIAKNHVKKQ